ncbi:MAG: glyoxal reductase [Epulopiscium sp. Nuni2H_MBin003]|nr:MAG: glyoxal reductase [Epulopiscium sp. Nuni2H_MBin003]
MEFTLNNGMKMPAIGLGVWQTEKGSETVDAVKSALNVGYRHIDGAMIYKNEAEVGTGIKESGVNRDEIFLTTKLWNTDTRNRTVAKAYQTSLDTLGLDIVDLYLIHWAVDGYVEAWSELEKLYDEKKIKSIGVSNFQIHHLEEIAKTAKYVPAVNQIESHPYFANQELINYCQQKGIIVTAYCPLGGARSGGSILKDPVITEIADKIKKTPAQVILRWHLQRGVVAIPKSKSPERIKENFDVFDFSLSDEDMNKISALNTNIRHNADPDNVTF